MAPYLKHDYTFFIKNESTGAVIVSYDDITDPSILIPDRGCSFSIYADGLYSSASLDLTRQQLDEAIQKVQAGKAVYVPQKYDWGYRSYWYLYQSMMYEFGVLLDEGQALEIIQSTEKRDAKANREQEALIEKYLISLKQAQEASSSAKTNFSDECMKALFFADSVLRIDPANVIALISKAELILYISKSDDHDYDEAIAYLKKAESVEPLHPLVVNAKWKLLKLQCDLLSMKGNAEEEKARKVSGFFDRRKKSAEFYKKAMTFYLMGLRHDPENLMLLRCVHDLYKQTRWIEWGSKVDQKVAQFNKLEQERLKK